MEDQILWKKAWEMMELQFLCGFLVLDPQLLKIVDGDVIYGAYWICKVERLSLINELQ